MGAQPRRATFTSPTVCWRVGSPICTEAATQQKVPGMQDVPRTLYPSKSIPAMSRTFKAPDPSPRIGPPSTLVSSISTPWTSCTPSSTSTPTMGFEWSAVQPHEIPLPSSQNRLRPGYDAPSLVGMVVVVELELVVVVELELVVGRGKAQAPTPPCRHCRIQ